MFVGYSQSFSSTSRPGGPDAWTWRPPGISPSHLYHSACEQDIGVSAKCSRGPQRI